MTVDTTRRGLSSEGTGEKTVPTTVRARLPAVARPFTITSSRVEHTRRIENNPRPLHLTHGTREEMRAPSTENERARTGPRYTRQQPQPKLPVLVYPTCRPSDSIRPQSPTLERRRGAEPDANRHTHAGGIVSVHDHRLRTRRWQLRVPIRARSEAVPHAPPAADSQRRLLACPAAAARATARVGARQPFAGQPTRP